MADEEHELPVVLIVPAPSGHASEPDAVLDDVQQLTIGEVLRRVLPQVRRGWVEPFVDHRLSAPVVRVAEGAVVREVIPSLRDIERARRQGVREPLDAGWRGEPPGAAGEE